MTEPGYRSIHEGAAIGAIAARAQIAVAGKDRAAFLQGLLTNDILVLTPGTGCYAAWLTPQGRMLTDMHVLESGTMILLDVPAELAEATSARLEQFLFTEDVKVGPLSGVLTGVWLHGPLAASMLERALTGASELGEWPGYHHSRFELEGEPVSVARIDQLGVPGYCVYLEPAKEAALVSALQSAGATVADREAIAAARIEAGYPVYGVDLTEDTIPLEAGIEDRAISFSKGCYVGQEVVIRVMHRGHGRVARKLVGLGIDGGLVAAGARMFSGDRDVGFLTSVARSPRRGTVALGYLHRDFVAPGTTVEVMGDNGRVPALVTR